MQPRSGAVRFDGEEVTARTTSHRIRRGMAIVPENRRLFAPMTVRENLEMGAYLYNGGSKEDYERVYSLFPLLYERRSQLAGTLSGGEQQMVAMGRALMARPKLLLMDEPSMGLAPILVERSFEIIKSVHEAGVAVLVVEQNANVSLSIADRGYVLSTGRVVLEGKAAGLAAERGADGRRTLAVELHDACRRRCRHRFPIFEKRVYVNSCSQGALSDAVRDSYEQYLRDWDEYGAPWEYWVERTEAARTAFAKLINAAPEEIAVTTSLSAGVAALASGLRFAGPRHKVVLDGLGVPDDRPDLACAGVARRARRARARGRGRDDPAAPLPPRHRRRDEARLGHARLLSQRRDARRQADRRARARARRAGAARLVPVDRLAADRREGARRRLPRRGRAQVPARLGGLGFLYCRRELWESAWPTATGWFADRNVFEMDIHDYSPAPDARRFQSGTPPVPSIYAGIAGIELMQEIGIAATREARAPASTELLIEGVDDLGGTVATPRNPSERGALVCIRSTDAERLVAELGNEGIVTSSRDGNLRVSPHAYNTPEDIKTLLWSSAAAASLLA